MSKLFYGKGVNSRREHKTKIGGTHTLAYRAWHNMIVRCYCAKLHAKQPTYADCTIDDRWLGFQDFADWFYANPYSNMGYQLDKDLLLPNNKIYNPETCCFVPQELNNLLLSHTSARGDLPQGVCLHKPSSKFMAGVKVDGKREHLGLFDTETEAYQAYKIAKERYVKNKALEWVNRIEWNVFQALMNWTLES